MPAGVDAAEAAALILSWTTAYQLLHRAARVQRGQRALVQGAAGAVGHNKIRPHQALGYKTSTAARAAEVSPVDLPLRLDDAGAPPTTPQDQQQQNVIHI